MKFAERLGVKIGFDRSRFQPGIAKQRLLALRMDPHGHPIPGETRANLLAAGLTSCLRFPYLSALKRVVSAVGFLFIALAPKQIVARSMSVLASPAGRGRLMDKMTRNYGN